MTEYSLNQRPPLQMIELLKSRMDSASQEKLEHILPHFPDDLKSIAVIVSIGAGTGLVEATIQKAYPEAKVIAIDNSPLMIEEIKNQPLKQTEVTPILADGKDIPIASNSVDVIIASSSLHEIISFGDNHAPGNTIESFFQEAFRILKPGGRIIIRDFMQPENPKEEILLKVGEVQTDSDVIPREFILKFIEEFKGDDLSYVKRQVENLPNKSLQKGSKLKIKAKHALEIAIHYSWASRFEDEIKEKYAFLPINEYAKFAAKHMSKNGLKSTIITTQSFLQPGYPQHINGRIDFLKEDGLDYPLPPFTGVIVIEKNQKI